MAPEYMTEPLDETPSGAIDFAALDRLFELDADVIAAGSHSHAVCGCLATIQCQD